MKRIRDVALFIFLILHMLSYILLVLYLLGYLILRGSIFADKEPGALMALGILFVGFLVFLIFLLFRQVAALEDNLTALHEQISQMKDQLTRLAHVNVESPPDGQELENVVKTIRESPTEPATPVNEQEGDKDEQALKETSTIIADPKPVRMPSKEPSSPFPTSLAKYLDHLEETSADRELIGPKFLREGILTVNNDGAFLLVKKRDISQERFWVIPRYPMFQTKDVFHTHYREFFECSNPSAGKVLIICPAEVVPSEVEGEWKLENKGRLEME